MAPHRRSRKSPGARPLTSQRDQYLALMRQGMSNAAASHIVGLNRKTVRRVVERRGRPPELTETSGYR